LLRKQRKTLGATFFCRTLYVLILSVGFSTKLACRLCYKSGRPTEKRTIYIGRCKRASFLGTYASTVLAEHSQFVCSRQKLCALKLLKECNLWASSILVKVGCFQKPISEDACVCVTHLHPAHKHRHLLKSVSGYIPFTSTRA